MPFPPQRNRYVAQTARAWAAILLCFALILLGMFGPTLAIVRFYYEPLCHRFAEERGAQSWSYLAGSRTDPKSCRADTTVLSVMALGGPTALVLTFVHDFFPPFGMVLGLIAGAWLWQGMGALLDRPTTARGRPRKPQRDRRI